MLFRTKPAPIIEFRCAPEDKAVIAEPLPAKKVLPDWFRALPAVDKNHVSVSDNGLTIKRCMPFLDAMMTGWILPLAADVRLEIKDDGQTVNAGWEFDKVMVSNHNSHQVKGNPREPRPPCKFHNYWTIVTPPGWSCLFVAPLNRTQGVFEAAAGIVDTDTYKSLIHFPFFPIADDGIHTIKKGTPIVQVIPFQRQTTDLESVIRCETDSESASRVAIQRNTQSTEGWYREHARAAR